MSTIKINGKDYNTESLSREAKKQLQAIQATDQEISRLKVRLAIAQTARNTYGKALQELLEQK
jgi:hypothetical protein